MQCAPPCTLTVIPSFFCGGKKWVSVSIKHFCLPLMGHTVRQRPGPGNLQSPKMKRNTFFQGAHCCSCCRVILRSRGVDH